MRTIKRSVSVVLFLAAVAAVVEQLMRPTDERDWHGRILFLPYDFRRPTPARIRERWWNADDPRLLTPHVFGVGWSVNLYRLKEILLGPGGPAAAE
jgi:uncharacterized protein DUF5808